MLKLKQSNKDGMWYFHMTSGNNEVILQSEGYTTKAMAIKGMVSILTNSAKLAIKKALGMSWYTEVVDTTVVEDLRIGAFPVPEKPVEEPVAKKSRKKKA